ncbi:unnamed protein product [Owenia fusiformis]|uniref:Uncharacterized protein n=1 Tax=Owenia fusiformis TaxID=6347 RepID=A0A8J1Y0S8_OWEFU|nr:unnamed protein product [Owenia fusiformis]
MPVVNTELQATCSALGYQEGNTYVREPDCLETVKDLIRFLKREEETCDIRRQLGEVQILQNDLIPILKEYKDDKILVETVLRLMVNLTQPAILCFRNFIPEDKTTRKEFIEVEGILRMYKAAFADEALFAVLTKKLGDNLQLDWESRHEDDRMLIERILILVRNILHIQPDLGEEKRTDDDASIHDQVLWALHVSGMEDLLLYIASSQEERQFAMHCLEIVSLMFKEQTPEQLANAGSSRSLTEKERDERELELVREKERAQKKANMKKFSTRHSRFGGTYVVSNMQSITENSMIYHRSLGEVNNISFDHEKRPKKRGKNRKPITEADLTRRSTLSIRMFLKDFCVNFLENCYNPLMYAVKDNINHSKTQDNDETYYLWAMRFFMEFSRLYKFRIDVIGETMSSQAFHFVQTNLTTYFEMISMEKKDAKIWSRRVHIALRAYYELLQTLFAMDSSKDPQLRESANVIKGNVFYLMEYRDTFINLLKNFNESRQSRAFLTDLVDATHLYTKMLEKYSKGHSHLMVQKKRKKSKKKKKQQAAPPPTVEAEFSPEQLDDMWDEVSSDLSAIFQGRGNIPEDVTPFDAASEEDIDQQRMDAMMRVQESLRENRPGEAIALFRAAREVWPENDEFGSADMSPEDEFMALREVFMANLHQPAPPPPPIEESDHSQEEDTEDEMPQFHESETEFEFGGFIRRFCQTNVLKAYTLLFADFKKNSNQTNHACVKMFHRMAVDLDLPGMLFQMRLFRIFQEIMFHPSAKSQHMKELVKFAHFIVRKFFEVAAKNDKVFIEILFWKNVRESTELMEGGYGTYKAEAKSGKVLWSEEEEMELQQLYEQYRDMEGGDLDVVDNIMVHIIDQTKTRRQIIKKLTNLELIENAASLKKSKGGAPRGVWLEEHEAELRELFEKHKDADDIMGNIIPEMSIKRSKKKVQDKILELGLVTDKTKLYKRRARKSGGKKGKKGGNPWEEGANDELLPTDSSSDDDPAHNDAHHPTSESSMSSDGESSDNEEPSADDATITHSEQATGSVKDMMVNVIENGMSDQIVWIKEGLQRTAADKEEDGDDGDPIPIVPITEENCDAMENATFAQFLQIIGITPPSEDNQQAFWRIPGSMSAPALCTLADALDPDDPDKANTITPVQAKQPKKKDPRKKMLKKLAKQKRKDRKAKEKDSRHKKRMNAANFALTPSTSGEKPNKTKKKSRLRAPIRDNSSDSDSDADRLIIDTSHASPVKSKAKKTQKAPEPKETENQFKSKEFISDDDSSSDDDKPLTKSKKSTDFPRSQKSGMDSDSDSSVELDRSTSQRSSRGSRSPSQRSRNSSQGSNRSRSSSRGSRSSSRGSRSSSRGSRNSSRGSRTSSRGSRRSSRGSRGSSRESRSSSRESNISASGHKSESDKENEKPSQVTSDSSSDDEPLSMQRKRNRNPTQSSDSESDTNHSKKPTSKRARLGSDSDEDDSNDKTTSDKYKDLASFPATMMSQNFSDSDSDVNDHIPLRRAVKRTAIESDSE